MGELKHDGLAIPARVVLAHEPPLTLGKLRINPATRLIENGDGCDIVEPRIMQVLVTLARANGAIVTRDELIERCWDGRVVGEDAINRTLSRIRHVAAGIGEGSFRIETITKVGYRLIVNGTDGIEAERASVCVLPFVNMSGDPEQEYFSDGISEDITTDLSKISALSVTARNTAFMFKGEAADIRAVARRLRVSHVIEGSVRKIANRVRISAQLIDGETGNHIWAERYDRDMTDIFAIQDEISEAIVRALKLKLVPKERECIERRETASAEAYDLYLMARQYRAAGYFCDLPREEAIVRLCKRATEIDPDYAEAWALLALAQGNLFRAYTIDGNADDGAAAAERALAINPSIAEARLPKAWRLAAEGRFEEANAELAVALALSPDSWEVNWEAGRLFYRQRRMTDAARCLARAAEQSDGEFHGWGMLAACYTTLDDLPATKHCAAKLLEQVEGLADNPVALSYAAWSFARLGQVQRSRKCVDRALLLGANNLFVRYTLSWILLTSMGDDEAALELLEPFLRTARQAQIWLAANDATLDGLRGNRRFQSLLASAIDRVGLPSAAITEGPVT
jgi:adenylate cyclase